LQCLEILKAAAQINTALKVGVMWDHNGTYMEGFGFQYRDQQVQINLTPEDDLAGKFTGRHEGRCMF